LNGGGVFVIALDQSTGQGGMGGGEGQRELSDEFRPLFILPSRKR
jgi:hypothetical protein